jgi:hypothetical protein
VDDQVAMVADGLNAINMESSPSAIERFNRAVRKLIHKPNTDAAVSVSSLFGSMIRSLIDDSSLREHSLKQSRTSKNE